MEKFFHKKENSYTSLKKDLLNKSMSFEEIRNKLLEKDQSNLSRNASLDNLNFLALQNFMLLKT